MNILHIIIGWLVLMAGYMLWNKFREDRKTGKAFWNFGDSNFLIRAILLLLVIWLSFTIAAPEPHFKSDNEQVQYGNETNQPWLSSQALLRKAKAFPDSLDFHFQLLESHFAQESSPYTPPDIRAFNREGVAIFNCYTDFSEDSVNEKRNDIGYLFLANWYIGREGHDADNAAFCLRQVQDLRLKYVNYTAGKIAFQEAGPLAAEPYFEDEIRANGYKKGAWEELAWIYDLSGRSEALEKLVYDPQSRHAVPEHLRYKVYFLNGDLISYYGLRFSSMFSTLPLWGILGNLLILFTWLFFLRRLSFLSPVKWKHFALAIGIGAILAMSSWMLYEFYHHILHFNTNGEIGNDFLYCFLGIGTIEELVKLIPFLILLRFTKIIKKPIDYILVASAAGLGFAFFENLLYISQYGLDVIHTRALTASVSHMASSAIVAYGFVLVKFRYPGKYWIIPLFFIGAALAHGFYDFWLLNEKVRSLSILTLFFYLSEILVYVSFVNITLNQSAIGRAVSEISLSTQKLASFIAGALILVFAIEYTGTCLVYGTTIGNTTLMDSFLSGGYLVFFLSVRLSNIDIVPGEWSKIEFFTGLLPSDLMGRTRKSNLNSLVGRTVIFKQARPYGPLDVFFPFSGKITKRLTIQKDNSWFELKPDLPLPIGGINNEILYFKIKTGGEMIGRGEPVRVGVFMRVPDPLNMEKSKLSFLDWADAD